MQKSERASAKTLGGVGFAGRSHFFCSSRMMSGITNSDIFPMAVSLFGWNRMQVPSMRCATKSTLLLPRSSG